MALINTYTFHLFSTLPGELRLKIWEFALPGPRTIELQCSYGLKHYKKLDSDGPPNWGASSSEFTSLALLRVNHEARNATLEYCGTIIVLEEIGQPAIALWANFRNDTIYMRNSQIELMDGLLIDAPPWAARVHSLGINFGSLAFSSMLSPYGHERPHFSVTKDLGRTCVWNEETHDYKFGASSEHNWIDPDYVRFSQFNSVAGRAFAVRYLEMVFRVFPGLVELLLIIDGRNPNAFPPLDPVEIFEPTSEHECSYQAGGRTMVSAWTPGIVEELRATNPGWRVPKVKLVLMINGEGKDTPEGWERRWDYTYARARYCSPGSRETREDLESEDDLNSESESEEEGWRAGHSRVCRLGADDTTDEEDEDEADEDEESSDSE